MSHHAAHDAEGQLVAPRKQSLGVTLMTTPTPFQKPLEQDGGMKYEDMTSAQKRTFVAKLIVCVATFGFAFPNVQKE